MSGALKITRTRLPCCLGFGYTKAKGGVTLKETSGGLTPH